jgi:hypothetical protein
MLASEGAMSVRRKHSAFDSAAGPIRWVWVLKYRTSRVVQLPCDMSLRGCQSINTANVTSHHSPERIPRRPRMQLSTYQGRIPERGQPGRE